LLGLIIFLAAWTAGLVWLGASIGLWRWELLQGTVIWFMGSALVLLFNVDKIEKDPAYLRHRASALVAWTVLVTFFINLTTLPLDYELALQPMLAGLILLSVAGEYDETRRRAGRRAEILLALVGTGLLGYSAAHVANHWSEFIVAEQLRSFLLPVWLTLGLLPMVYSLAVVFAYDGARRRISLDSPSRRATARALLALVIERVVRPDEVSRFRLYWARQLAIANSLDDARQVVVRLRGDLAEQQRVQEAREERLRMFAGVGGTNEFGIPLDQREFEETIAALRRLASNQMGWYRTRGNRYQPQPFDFFRTDLERDGLCAGYDVRHELARDGQSWWVSRRTASGWVLGIGADGPPPDQWVYEGADHPTGLPERSPGWCRPWDAESPYW